MVVGMVAVVAGLAVAVVVVGMAVVVAGLAVAVVGVGAYNHA